MTRQAILPKTVYFDNPGEMVLDIECIKEDAPKGWPLRKRFNVCMVGMGVQRGTDFVITQYASNYDRELMDTVAPSLRLARRIFIEARGNFDAEVLAGRWVSARKPKWDKRPLWPTLNIDDKVFNVRQLIRQQGIGPQVDRKGDITGKQVLRMWDDKKKREAIWSHNYLDLIDTARKIFQIEWPPEEATGDDDDQT